MLRRLAGAARRRVESRGDGGFTLLEVLVALAIIAAVSAPAALFIIQSGASAAQMHLRIEATDAATQQLETLQAEAGAGMLPTGSTTTTKTVVESGSRTTTFTVTTNFEAVVQGSNQSICSQLSAINQQIWLVTATVTWPHMDQNPISQTTEIAPAQAGAIEQFAGELAIRLSTDGTPADLFTASPPGVQATVTGTWTGGGSHTAPSGTYTTEGPYNSGSSGCIVFNDLDTTAGEVYTVSLSGNPTLSTGGESPGTSGQEFSDNNPNGALQIGPITLQAGVPDIQTVTINTATSVNIQFAGPIKSPATCPTAPNPPTVPATTSQIPISVNNSYLSTYAHDTYVAYNSTSAAQVTSLQLFPFSGSTTMWAGDQTTSNPGSVYGASAPAACSVTTTAGSVQTMYLPLYPLKLTITAGSPTTLTAQEAMGASYTYALNLNGGSSQTSLPLGEYVLSDQNGALGAAHYVWLTPSGECTDTGINPSPPASCSANNINTTAP